MSLISLSSARRVILPRWLPLAAVFAAALVMVHIVPTNPDVSWGLTMAEKWLDGARLYIDIVEVNPPATVFLYVAPVWFARLTGLSPETATNIFVFASIALSLCATARIVVTAKLVSDAHAWPLLTVAAAVLTVLLGQSFGEREHFAIIALLPMLAVQWMRAERLTPSWGMCAIAGVVAGLTAVIKPYFAAAIIASAAAAALSARSWRVLFAPENWIAAAVLAAYTVVVWQAYPVFFSDMLPLLAAVYIPIKEPLGSLFMHVALPLWALIVFALWAFIRFDLLKPPVLLLLAASCGFVVTYVIQQKGWPNHTYPMLSLALLALGYAILTMRVAARERLIAGLAGLAIGGASTYWMLKADEYASLAQPIRAIAPHAKVLAISPHLTVGHPAVRAAGGVWVGRVAGLWITQGVLMARAHGGLDPALVKRLAGYAEMDRTMLIEDIGQNRPDVILVQREPEYDWMAWAMSDPALAAALSSYRLETTVGDIRILRRVNG